jgi:hypothetical protein
MTKARVRGLAIGVCSVALGALVTPSQASAQAVCADINNVPGFKIVLDDIQFDHTPPDDQKVLMRLLISQLGSRLEDLPDPAPVRYHLVPCPGRTPVGEASFPPMTVKDLVTRDVLLEVWGDVFRPSGGRQLVAMNYVMMPLPRDTVNPFVQRQYERKVVSSPDEVVEWLAGFDEISAYATVGRAIRVIDSQGAPAYDSAKADLAKAAQALRRAYGPHPIGAQKQLLDYVDAQQCTLLQKARHDPAYQGTMRLLPQATVDRTCAAGGNQ